MTDFLFARPSLWQGFGSVLDLGGAWFESNRSLTPAQADRIAMQQDWLMVGRDLRAALDQYRREFEAAQARLPI